MTEQVYLDLLRDIMENGVTKTDRTGTGTKSVFGRQLKFDLALGFPLLTTKKLHFNSIIHELIWFLKGDTNIKYLKDNKVSIWNEWADKNGNLGPIYSHMWRRIEIYNSENIVKIDKRLNFGVNKPFEHPVTSDEEIKKVSNIGRKDDLFGKEFVSKQSGKYRVLGNLGTNEGKNSYYNVIFTKTKTIVQASRPNIRYKCIDDPYVKTVFDEGCIGVIENKPTYYDRAYVMWFNMLKRCYDSTCKIYKDYGCKGIYVDQSWLCFANFLQDITQLSFFNDWKNGFDYEIDKDYYAGMCYSKHTCIFLPREYNRSLANKDFKVFQVLDKNDNVLYLADNIGRLERKTGLNADTIGLILKGKKKEYKGFKFKYVEEAKEYVYRREMIIDQIAKTVELIRKSPESRRIVLDAWQIPYLNNMALTPCHCLVQFNVRIIKGTRYLDCSMYQRSADSFLGVPYNIASYAILTHMLAQLSLAKVGILTISFGDIHIYSNHVEQVKEQLKRKSKGFPTLKMNKHVNVIDDFKADHFEVLEYNPHPSIKAPIAV